MNSVTPVLAQMLSMGVVVLGFAAFATLTSKVKIQKSHRRNAVAFSLAY